MTRFWPKSLFGQMLLILLAGLIVSNLVAAWIYSIDREAAVRQVGGLAAAQRIANLTRLIEDAPAEWRERIVGAVSDPGFRVSLSRQRPDIAEADEQSAVAAAIRGYLTDRLGRDADRQPLVAASPVSPSVVGGPAPWRPMMMRGMGDMMSGPGAMMGGSGLFALDVGVPLPQGQWLTFSTALPAEGPGVSRELIVSMLVMAVIIVAVSVWAARRVTRPLAVLAGAAQRLGADVHAPPIPETGTIETRQASHAFNDMQVRLRELIENRTRLLAAISHDLRTPLTLLRLRAENVADANERERMLATLADMEGMVGAILQYARDEMATEQARRTDLTALVQSIVDDMSDAGLHVEMEAASSVLVEAQPAALKRAITNLIDNAVKYGHGARVALHTSAKDAEVTVDDEGPGIPEEELARVFEPFYRVEASRSRESGGVGLGLAIAQSLVQRNRGSLTLQNRPSGGLRALVRLPKSA
jgi:signal transduction histidine kinase